MPEPSPIEAQQFEALMRMLLELDATDAPVGEPLRIWLVTQAEEGKALFLQEENALARLITSQDGVEFLRPPDRRVLGVAFSLIDTIVPSPIELAGQLHEALVAENDPATKTTLTAKWRLQRLQKQSAKAAVSPARWASYCLRNGLADLGDRLIGITLGPDQRATMLVGAHDGQAVPIQRSEEFWAAFPVANLADAVFEYANLRVDHA